MTNAPVTYDSAFLPSHEADRLYVQLRALDWKREVGSPRCEYYCNDFPRPYTYGVGKGRRTYRPRPWTDAITFIRERLETYTQYRFEVCFLNRYLNQSDALGWHSDDSPEMDDARPIAIVSFGVEREIWFRPIPVTAADRLDVTNLHKVKLAHGSLCLMAPGMQDAWQHRIPKASFQCGERISLTFRGYVDPAP